MNGLPPGFELDPEPGQDDFTQRAGALMQKLSTDFGLTPEQAAGIVGNLGHESAGLQAGIQERNPTAGRGGLGWAQWTGPRRRSFEQYLQDTGRPATDPDANYGYLKAELTGQIPGHDYSGALDAVRKASGLDDSTVKFEQAYERAGVKNYPSRLDYARKALGSSRHVASMREKYAPNLFQQAAGGLFDAIIPSAQAADQPPAGNGVMLPQGFEVDPEPQAMGGLPPGFELDPEPEAPPSGMSQFAEGVKQSLWDTGTAIGQGARAVLPEDLANQMELPSRASVDADAARRSGVLQSGPGMAGKMVGDIGQMMVGGAALKGVGALANAPRIAAAGDALMMPRTLPQAAGAGALTGALEPLGTNDSLGGNMAAGAAGGAVGYGALKGLGKAIAPRLSPEVQKLMDEGVEPTVGQMMGRTARGTEDKLTSIPGAGDVIRSQKERALRSFNTATINKVLKPLGQTLPKDVEPGYPAVKYAADKISETYNAVLPKLTVPIDRPFQKGIDRVVSHAAAQLPQPQAEQLTGIVQTQLLDRTRGGVLSGQAMNDAHSNLSRLASNYGSSPDPDQRAVGQALKNVTTLLLNKVERANPGARSTLRAVRDAHALQVRIEKAAAGLGAKEGVFTGAQLANATKAADKSARKRATAQGRAPLQEWAEAGDKVLGQKIPDSGTPGRGLASLAALGIGAWEPSTIAMNAGLAGLYTDPIQAAARRYALNPPAWRETARSMAERAAPGAGLLSSTYASTRR